MDLKSQCRAISTRVSRRSVLLGSALALLAAAPAHATTYYVCAASANTPTCSNTNSGTSSSAAWRTVSKVNGAALSPGDIVRFKSGDTFPETLDP